jgi:hypothetical protein
VSGGRGEADFSEIIRGQMESMHMTSPDAPTPEPIANHAAEQVADAQRLLKILQQQLGKHPELDQAIGKLELALSALTLQTGGLL